MIVHMIGNAHLDPVWLWSWQEGVDEALASLASAVARCDEYPDFLVTRGEAWLYQQIETLDPALFARVRELIEANRWEPTGGQWLQPDANLPTVWGWKRQLAHGQKYFRDKFNVAQRVGYNVDSFGHPATLPDILRDCGFDAYVFCRPNAQQVELPSQTFRWRGSGGAEVTAFRIAPTYVTRTDDLYGQIMRTVAMADQALGHTMCFYGVGNHGGGPTKGNIEYILEHRDAFPGLELQFSTPQRFFDAIAARRADLPVVETELQRTFPGCYSVMHDIKAAQHRGEGALDACEQVIEAFSDDKAAHHQRLNTAWNDLLFTQFHDILAGTSIPSSWESVRAMQGRARIMGEEIVLEATRKWARRALPPVRFPELALLNAGNATWSDPVEAEPFLDFDAWGERWLSDVDGNPIPFQQVQPEGAIFLTNRVLFPATIGARDCTRILVRDDARPATPEIESDLSVSAGHLSNNRMRVELRDGGIARLSCDGRELLGERGIGLHLRHDSSDTWSFHSFRYDEAIEAVLSGAWVVEEAGPLRARVRMESRLGHSSLRWTLSLPRDEPKLQMRLEINWDEKFHLLQMPLHLSGEAEKWADGLPGGHVERQAADEERVMQGWSRVRVNGADWALVTPDAYSLSFHQNVWQPTLLRSPKMAWGGGNPDIYAGRDWHTDQGAHFFEWTLMSGDDLSADALTVQARRMVQPPIVFSRYEGLNRPPWGNNPARRLWTGAEQRARRDNRMMHLIDDNTLGAEEAPQTAETD